jgi:pimeloyl-ACP methyl ester carboxylesterase
MLAGALALVAASAVGRMAPPASAQGARSLGPAQAAAHAYLLRGLMNIFSLGMDDLADEIRRAGIDAGVYNHADADAIVAAIVARYAGADRGPVILIGHSLGADAVMEMAQRLDDQNIPVALVVPFDGTESHLAPKNVATVINFTRHFTVQPGPGFHGRLENIDMSGDPRIDHTNIDKSQRLHTYVLTYVIQAANLSGRIGRTPRRQAPTAQPTATSPR